MGHRQSPRDVTEAIERDPRVSGDTRERFHGYGVMGLPFGSGHVLGLRRFPASSIGPGYTSIWHRAPDGRWAFWSTAAPELSCARYTGELSTDTRQTAIRLSWPEPSRLVVSSDAPRFAWEVAFGTDPASRMLGALARRLPAGFLSDERVLRALGPVAGALLGTGRLALTGEMPNGQTFHLVPLYVWPVTASHAELEGTDLGAPTALPEQARIGGFRIPQRGLLAVGTIDFDLLDPARHSTRTARA